MTDKSRSLAEQVRAGDRRALAKAITLVESTRKDHREQASSLLEALMPYSGDSVRVGISGAPGTGKSTFIDPSSAVTGGSILGDKTRMETLAFAEQAFVRPSPAGKTLGGVTRRTRESMLICEAAGFDVVLVETVGVGQSETAVADMTDMFLLLLSPSGGDELQGIKRGIMELADLVLVNKADGHQTAAAAQTQSDYRSAIHFMKSRFDHWQPPVMTCSALKNQGVEAVWAKVTEFNFALSEKGQLAKLRAQQSKAWMWSETAESLIADLKANPEIKKLVPKLETAVLEGTLPATIAAQRLVESYKKID